MKKSENKSRTRSRGPKTRRKNTVIPALSPADPPPPTPAQIKAALTPKQTVVGYSRVNWIFEELRAGKCWNTPKLMRELGVSESQVRRDINIIRIEFGHEVLVDPLRNTYYLADPSKPMPYVPITQGEFFTLTLAQEALGAHRDTRFGRTLQSGIAKSAVNLDRRLEGGLADLTKSVCFRTTGGSVAYDPIAFDTIAESLAARRELLFDYRSHQNESPTEWRLRPRCLVKQDAAW